MTDFPHRELVLSLAPWLRHHDTCARVLEAAACSCGLNDQLLTLIPTDAELTERQKAWMADYWRRHGATDAS